MSGPAEFVDYSKSELSEHNSKGRDAGSVFDPLALFQENRGSVVNVAMRMKIAGHELEQTLGSGFVIESGKSSCRVATDLHVAANAPNNLSVRMDENRSFKAILEHSDRANDLAILKLESVDNAASLCRSLKLSGSKRPVEAGQELQKLTARLLSPEYSQATVEEYFLRKQAEALPLLNGEDPERTMIYLNGPSENGDSGGPIIDASAQVVGIDSAKGNGGFAVTPSYYLKKSLDSLPRLD